jgi:hypothetical protein
MLPDSFGEGDLVRAAFSVYVTGAACLLSLYAQIISESNRKHKIFLISLGIHGYFINIIKFFCARFDPVAVFFKVAANHRPSALCLRRIEIFWIQE